MDEKDLQEFSLEDIIKEFSEAPLEAEEAVSEQISEQVEQISQEEEAVQAPSVTEATIRLDRIPETKGLVRNAQPIEDEEEEAPQQLPQEQTEPFSPEWEP